MRTLSIDLNLKHAYLLSGFLLLITLMVFQHARAEDNPFATNYYPQNNAGLVSMQAQVEPQMFRGTKQVDDNTSMLENGFDLMGSSSFDTGETSPDLALTHAKTIKADQVLLYAKQMTSESNASKMQKMREMAKENGGKVSEKVLANSGKRFKYTATYWAKLPPPLLGVHIVKLNAVNNGEATPEKGLKLIAVIKDSPAAKAELMRGDVLMTIGEMKLDKPDDLFEAVAQYQGQTVAVTYEREQVPMTANVALNSRKQ